METIITAVIVAAIGSSGLFAFLTFLINRHDGRDKQLKKICEDIEGIQVHLKELDEKNEQQDARTSRTRILRFDDELVAGKPHSREYFLQILDDCEIYEAWYGKHPEIKNGYAKAAVKHIRKVYDSLIESGEWRES